MKLEDLADLLKSHKLIDQVIPKVKDNVINISRSPYGFINNNNLGFEKSSENLIDNNTFIDKINNDIKKLGFNSKVSVNNYTCLPDNKSEFMSLF